MSVIAAKSHSGVTRSFQDGLGERFLLSEPETGAVLELLRLDSQFSIVTGFETAVIEQARRFESFDHFAFARIRRIERAPAPDQSISIYSDRVPGIRLSGLLQALQHSGQASEVSVALGLTRYLLSALEAFHQHAPEAVHGAISPERIIITPQSRLVILEYVIGPALRMLGLSRPALWSRFRVAAPPAAALPRFDQRTDIAQVGLVALALILGRSIQVEEFPSRLTDLLASATEFVDPSGRRPLSRPLRAWLTRTLQLDARWSFGTAAEAGRALDQLTLSYGYRTALRAIETFLARYQGQTTSGPGPVRPSAHPPRFAVLSSEPARAVEKTPVCRTVPASAAARIPGLRKLWKFN